MPLDLGAVVNTQEYRLRNGRSSSEGADETLLEEMLVGVTRVLERRLGVAPGMLLPQTALTFYFAVKTAGSAITLKDEQGWQYLLRDVGPDNIGIDSESDRTFDGYSLDFDDLWVAGLPRNNGALGLPYSALSLNPYVVGAEVTQFIPGQEVRITGDWGYASPPGAMKERVIGLTRELLDAHSAGPAALLQDIDVAIQTNVNARALMSVLEREYSYRTPAIA